MTSSANNLNVHLYDFPKIPDQYKISLIVFDLWEWSFELFLVKKSKEKTKKKTKQKTNQQSNNNKKNSYSSVENDRNG